jgi:hypothetical protein
MEVKHPKLPKIFQENLTYINLNKNYEKKKEKI